MPIVNAGKKRNEELYQKCQCFNKNKTYDGFVELITNNPYYNNRNKCKICGGELYYSNVLFRGAFQEHPKIYSGTSPISTKTINGNVYKLCVCEKCMSEHFKEWDDIKNKSRVYNRPTKYAQFAFDIPEDVIYKKNMELCVRSLDSFIKKYGEVEGNKRWNDYVEKQRITNTFEYKHAKCGMTEEEFDRYNKNRSCTLDNFIKRYGENEGIEKWNKYRKKEAYCNTRKYFIETYGEIEGLKKWENFDNARKSNRGYSFISQEFFRSLISDPLFENHEIYFAERNYEYEVLTENGSLYYLDFYDKTIGICIEFNGLKFHPKPGKYKDDEIFNGLYKTSNKTVKELIEKEEKRNSDIEKELKATVITVWEDDYKHNKRQCIQNTLDIIKKIVTYGKI